MDTLAGNLCTMYVMNILRTKNHSAIHIRTPFASSMAQDKYYIHNHKRKLNRTSILYCECVQYLRIHWGHKTIGYYFFFLFVDMTMHCMCIRCTERRYRIVMLLIVEDHSNRTQAQFSVHGNLTVWLGIIIRNSVCLYLVQSCCCCCCRCLPAANVVHRNGFSCRLMTVVQSELHVAAAPLMHTYMKHMSERSVLSPYICIETLLVLTHQIWDNITKVFLFSMRNRKVHLAKHK